jgi:hypothetical protein
MIQLRTEDDVLCVELANEFSEANYRALIDALRLYDTRRGACVLLAPDGLTGVQPAALWARLRVAVPPVVRRMAVVGDRPWERRYARFATSAYGLPVRHFPLAARAEALRWLRSDEPARAGAEAPLDAAAPLDESAPLAVSAPLDPERAVLQIDAAYDALDVLLRDTLGAASLFEHSLLVRLQWFAGTLLHLWWQEPDLLGGVLGAERAPLHADPLTARCLAERHRDLAAVAAEALDREMAAGRLRPGDPLPLARDLLDAAVGCCSLVFTAEGDRTESDRFRDELRAHAAVLAHVLFERLRAEVEAPLPPLEMPIRPPRRPGLPDRAPSC